LRGLDWIHHKIKFWHFPENPKVQRKAKYNYNVNWKTSFCRLTWCDSHWYIFVLLQRLILALFCISVVIRILTCDLLRRQDYFPEKEEAVEKEWWRWIWKYQVIWSLTSWLQFSCWTYIWIIIIFRSVVHFVVGKGVNYWIFSILCIFHMVLDCCRIRDSR
jgi:hypothetical protein